MGGRGKDDREGIEIKGARVWVGVRRLLHGVPVCKVKSTLGSERCEIVRCVSECAEAEREQRGAWHIVSWHTGWRRRRAKSAV